MIREGILFSASIALSALCSACSGDSDVTQTSPEPDCAADCGEDPLPAGGQSFDDGGEDPPPFCAVDERLVGERCEPLGEPGAACTADSDCRAGVCRYTAAACLTERCDDLKYDAVGVCGEPGQLGEGCVPVREQCGADLACSPQSLTCVLSGANSAPCASGGDCSGVLVCRSYTSGNACGPASARGEACNAYADCAQDLVCYADGQCNDPGRAASGTTCQDDPECASGLVCNTSSLFENVSPSCAEPRPLGGGCARHEECTLGALCIGRVCSSLGDSGDSCETDEQCNEGLRCNFGDPMAQPDSLGICREPAGPGLPCWRDADCEPGLDCEYPENPGPSEGGACASAS